MMASRLVEKYPLMDNLIDDEQLDPIRNYVRFNNKNENWTYSVKKNL